jgi:hypothetical protein
MQQLEYPISSKKRERDMAPGSQLQKQHIFTRIKQSQPLIRDQTTKITLTKLVFNNLNRYGQDCKLRNIDTATIAFPVRQL